MLEEEDSQFLGRDGAKVGKTLSITISWPPFSPLYLSCPRSLRCYDCFIGTMLNGTNFFLGFISEHFNFSVWKKVFYHLERGLLEHHQEVILHLSQMQQRLLTSMWGLENYRIITDLQTIMVSSPEEKLLLWKADSILSHLWWVLFPSETPPSQGLLQRNIWEFLNPKLATRCYPPQDLAQTFLGHRGQP